MLPHSQRLKMEDSDYEDLEESNEYCSMQNYDDEEGYNKMMREIDDEIQDQMMKDMLSDRNNKPDNVDFLSHEYYKENLRNLKKNDEDDEWEDIDQLEEAKIDTNEDSPLSKEEDYEWDEEEEEDIEGHLHPIKEQKPIYKMRGRNASHKK